MKKIGDLEWELFSLSLWGGLFCTLLWISIKLGMWRQPSDYRGRILDNNKRLLYTTSVGHKLSLQKEGFMLVKCDFCPNIIEATEERACAWMGDKATNWICDKCNGISEQLWEQSDMMRDMHESELAEMEGADL